MQNIFSFFSLKRQIRFFQMLLFLNFTRKKMKVRLIISLLIFCSPLLFSQNYDAKFRSPIDFEMSLSSNFGELRPNHFHSGVDFKTQGVINKKIYAIEDGYISRIGVNAGGYGLVLYVDHPRLGFTSVYGHLNKFSSNVAAYVKKQQYEKESYTIDLQNLSDTIFPVKKGQIIAFSGNTGSSGGPHLHFEIRETLTEHPVDPLFFYKMNITDDKKPEIRGVSVYQLDPSNNLTMTNNYYPTNVLTKNGNKIKTWGKIGLGINAIDRMTGTSNIYGVKIINLYCDGNLIFSYDMDHINFSTTRMINSLTDYDRWKKTKQFYVKSNTDSGNALDVFNQDLAGFIDVDEEKVYKIKYELKDIYDNTTTLNLDLIGDPKLAYPKEIKNIFYRNMSNRYAEDGLSLYLPTNSLYENIDFNVSLTQDSLFHSDVYTVGNKYTSLLSKSPLGIQIKNDTVENKRQYGIVSINNKGKKSWIGGNYENGVMFAFINELGNTLAVDIDNEAPKIIPIDSSSWTKNNKIVIKLTDNLSGIKSFKGTIDGKFALFQHDIKSSNYTYIFDPQKIQKGKHLLKFSVVDNAGNENYYETNFIY